MHLSRQWTCWSLRCSWSIACRRCSNCIFILDLTSGFNGLDRDNSKTKLKSLKFWDLVHIILEIIRYSYYFIINPGFLEISNEMFSTKKPRKKMGNLFHAPKSYVCHFIAIHQFQIGVVIRRHLNQSKIDLSAPVTLKFYRWPWK